MKTVLITGGAGNLGRSVVEKFLLHGYHVTVTLEPNFKVDDAFRNRPNLTLAEVDVTHEDAAQKFISTLPPLDAAIMLVGGFAMSSLAETDTAAISKMMTLNFNTAYNAAKPAFENMKSQQRGSLVFIGARGGLDLKDGSYAVGYALSKSLIFRLAELFNAEGKPHNIRASVIVPSVIDTPINRAAMPDADVTAWVKPETLADAIYFVCTETGSALCDTVLKVYNRA
jgi:NAD(P)-dependent dehydrogenase (short-subunit alcohol dehydrogenase family)